MDTSSQTKWKQRLRNVYRADSDVHTVDLCAWKSRCVYCSLFF